MILGLSLPAYGIGVIGYVIVGWISGTSGDSFSTAFGTVIFFGATGAFTYWMLGSLKQLQIEGDQLIMSNYLKRISTPLTNVAEITGQENSSHQRIHVRFKSQTGFGNKIVFMPPIFSAKSTANTFRFEVETAEKREKAV